jgi:transcriptional regulator with XRE-family HTH domain
MKMGINYEGSNKGNNKTQSEIEAKTGLTDQTINQIRIAFESGIEALIEMYIKMTSLQETYKYKVEDVENKEFKFYLKPEISAQDVDSTIKLVQAQV